MAGFRYGVLPIVLVCTYVLLKSILTTLKKMTEGTITLEDSSTASSFTGIKVLALGVTILIFLILAIVYRRLLYCVAKSFPRDIRGIGRFVRVGISLHRAQRKNLTVSRIFDQNVRKHPNKVCFYFEDEQWTFKQVQDLSYQVANYFQSQGYKKGDSIALFMENKPEYVCIWLGLSRVGIVAALINSNLKQESLLHSIELIKSKAIIFGTELTEVVKEVLDLGGVPKLPLYSFGTRTEEYPLEESIDLSTVLQGTSPTEPMITEKVGCYDSLYYIYTSGTTGLPKAAAIRHIRFFMAVFGVHYMDNVSSNDIQYSVLPLYHSAAGMLGVGQPLCFGTSMVIRTKFSASNFWSDCIKYKVTVAQYIGEVCRYLISQPASALDTKHSVRTMYGNGLRTEIWAEFISRFGIAEIYELYGSTEGNCNMVNVDSRVGAVGFIPRLVYPVVPMKIIRVNEESGEVIRNPTTGFALKCGPNEPGELIGKIVADHPLRDFQGYADSSSKQKKIITDVFSKGDSYFRSGDMLVMDEYGYFYFKDRTGDTFRWKGENVSTAEVESVISKICGLKDAVVYGVQIAGTDGKAGMVAIADSEGTLDINTLADGITKALPNYSRPLFLRTLNKIDLTGTYKMKKLDLQKEGFDVNQIKDPLYFFSGGKYIPLDLTLYNQLLNGQIRL